MALDEGIIYGILTVIGILSFTGICFYGSYVYHQLDIQNFQTTIKDLSEEQKCLHICGFEFPSTQYFDNYKFCVEKCDRISERMTACVKV